MTASPGRRTHLVLAHLTKSELTEGCCGSVCRRGRADDGGWQAAPVFYNAAVNQLNNAIQIFPGQLIAAAAGVKTMPLFEAPAAERTAPSVDAILGPKP